MLRIAAMSSKLFLVITRVMLPAIFELEVLIFNTVNLYIFAFSPLIHYGKTVVQ